jgi:predicted 2-oxoglutarate/Fe(II)-dependent dioxygenase YbiX
MILKEKNIFTKDECDLIISYVDSYFKNWDKKDRKYNSHSIDYDTTNNWIFYRLKDFFEDQTGLKISKLKKQLHFHKFTKGDWFSRHSDVNDRRLYVVGSMLNDDFEGGDFIMYNDEKIILDKKVGNTYIFDVKIEHEITPITNGERYSLLWFLQNSNIIVEKKSLI